MVKTEMCCRVIVNGSNEQEDYKWAIKNGMHAYRRYVNVANNVIIPVYNWVWKILYPNTKNWVDEHPNYDKIYFKISRTLANCMISFKGYDFKNKRKVYIDPCFTMKPTDEEHTYIIDDMIYIKSLSS